MSASELKSYEGTGRLMPNYGWVQNTSNLSTVRNTVELVPEDGINHNTLMRRILSNIKTDGKNRKRDPNWDARCRVKAICASGMVELDRTLQGYRLTELGRLLCATPKSANVYKGHRILSNEEKELFKEGILTNPPVVRVLSLLNESRKSGNGSMSKYDIGGQLGFIGAAGFTHYEEEFVVLSGKRFCDAEGDSDKWARTIIGWLVQVGWVVRDGYRNVYGKKLQLFTTLYDVDRVLRYSARSAVKYIPQEMLCSDKHQFTKIIQERRASILKMLKNKPQMLISEMVETMQEQGIDTDTETLAFDIVNLQQAGIQIFRERSYYRLADKINIDTTSERPRHHHANTDGVERQIEHYISVYEDSLPPRLVDNLIRFGLDGTNSSTHFEITVDKFFLHMGYDSNYLGQGQGRVADVIAKYRDVQNPKSYALIIDAKAYERYSFPVGDVRKMKEYIRHHGDELLQDRIPRHAFAFVSMDFINPVDKLEEIATDTAVNGTAIDVYTLLELGSKIMQQQVSISDLYPEFTTNQQFICPSI